MELYLIQYLGLLQLVPCLQGWAFSATTGLVPFGEVGRFLSPRHSQDEDHAFDSVMESTVKVKTSHLCFVLEWSCVC